MINLWTSKSKKKRLSLGYFIILFLISRLFLLLFRVALPLFAWLTHEFVMKKHTKVEYMWKWRTKDRLYTRYTLGPKINHMSIKCIPTHLHIHIRYSDCVCTDACGIAWHAFSSVDTLVPYRSKSGQFLYTTERNETNSGLNCLPQK